MCMEEDESVPTGEELKELFWKMIEQSRCLLQPTSFLQDIENELLKRRFFDVKLVSANALMHLSELQRKIVYVYLCEYAKNQPVMTRADLLELFTRCRAA